MSDSVELDLLKAIQTTTEAEEILPPPPVFVGINLKWNAKISDYTSNVRLAEKWERDFEHWTINNRTIHLGDSRTGYAVELSDGWATLTIQAPVISFFTFTVAHVQEIVDALTEGQRTDINIDCEVQYLLSETDKEFDALVQDTGANLLNASFFDALGGRMQDFNFLTEVLHQGHWFQVNIGVLKEHEVPRQVASRHLFEVPKLSRFYSVRSKDEISDSFDIKAFFGRVLGMGDSIEQGLRR